ncbi:MAG: hypothetical protein A2Z99_14060 [Treponema sp. GWB1_62_6]|nr:MAG: hypothetical protein A2001_15500 [Treponema sp. GWC1_61_84]OHE65681.1 MAG: hypothetical protein A2Z99_14060 [Treponema sp. GWB1_62_6]HCM26870.1 hypothetical protein [Treponema sp.]
MQVILYPSCGQKRALFIGEYWADDQLHRLPYRQFALTIPKALRGFNKRDRGFVTMPARPLQPRSYSHEAIFAGESQQKKPSHDILSRT